MTYKKTLTTTTLTADRAFTYPDASGTFALGTGTATRIAQWNATNILESAALIMSGANVLTLSATAASTLALAITADKTLTLTCADDYNLTVPATGTVALLGANNNFSVTQYIGDTANTGMTLGLTINQGAADDEILAFKSSDVAHGMTDLAETDTYAYFMKSVAASGGISLVGLSSGSQFAFNFAGYTTTCTTTKTTSTYGTISLFAGKKSGTGGGACDENTALLTLSNYTTTRFIFDAEGTLHHITGDNDLDILSLPATTGTPILSWDESEDSFSFSKGVIVGDGTNYSKINGTGDITLAGSAGFYPRVLSQAEEPAAGTGATQLDTSELCIWIDSDDSKCFLCFNQAGTVKTVELT